jgi:hypothetical protein
MKRSHPRRALALGSIRRKRLRRWQQTKTRVMNTFLVHVGDDNFCRVLSEE